jgi:hypothetical protein
MAVEIYNLPVRPETPRLPSGDARIATWHEFDEVGASLPKRSYAAEWNVARIVIAAGGVLFACALAWLMFRFTGMYVIFALGGLAAPARFLAERYKKGLFRRSIGEEDPADTVVVVSYEIDGFVYGIALLPPLDPSDQGHFRSAGMWGKTFRVGVIGGICGLILSLNVLDAPIVATLCIACGAGLAVLGHRALLWHRRRKAPSDLMLIRHKITDREALP